MKRARKLLVPSILACALLTALALAATASAEIRVGERTAPANPAISPEADIIGAQAEYDSDTGTVTFKVTTAAVPSPGSVAQPSPLQVVGGVATTSACDSAAITTNAVFPALIFQYNYAQPEVAVWELTESVETLPKPPETAGLAVLAASGTTMTFTAIAPKAVNRPFDCGVAGVVNNGQLEEGFLLFPLAVPPPAPAPVVAAPTPAAAPVVAAPAPAALAVAKAKPVKLPVGKWKTVQVKVANPGGTATAPGSLRLKAPRGVLVKPEKQKLPILGAGGDWTLTAKVQLTAKAKQKSTVGLTATAGGLTAKGSLVLKR